VKRTSAALLLGLLGLGLAAFRAFAQQEQPGVSNQSCLACHADPNLGMLLQNGEQLSLFIDSGVYAQSVHGQIGYACVQCHTVLRGYPHPSFQAAAQSASQASDLSVSAAQSVSDVEATVVQNAAQDAPGGPADATTTALQNGANSVAPTTTSQELTQTQQTASQPSGQTRDNTAETTRSEGTRTTGTVVIIIRRP